ncbi:copper amine oxidase N-terminal domain-containing protein [Cohnella lupini]|uniref:Copper amine oxidase-like protein n=1 Tax=Cohnella lupini TaxID=1294267 RepID=A0A3D9IJ47_9BACL|nr:copper amine oxidase N-terminal domain-containing protein [Cohnella lupini]RED61814.1 copper amine oxidase-like protein [Cohnella lupini]
MKRTLQSLTILSTLLAGTLAATAANAADDSSIFTGGSVKFKPDSPFITLGNKQIKVPTAPYSQNGTLMVPVRELAEGLHVASSWNSSNQSLKLTKGNQSILIKGNLITAGNKTSKLPLAIKNIKGKVFVPLRAITQAFGAKLSWDPKSKWATAKSSDAIGQSVAVQYSFANDAEGWAGGFADLPVKHEDTDFRLINKWTKLPTIGNQTSNGILLSGMNRSDDLFIYTAKKLTGKDGLKPNTTYRVKLSFQLATDEANDSMGVGGAPGASVYVKAGVLNFEPKANEVNESEGVPFYRMNLDKGNQSTDGKDMHLVGDAAKPAGSKEGFQFKEMQSDSVVKTGANGEAYLIIGTDSGYEGLSTLYISNVKAVFTPQS